MTALPLTTADAARDDFAPVAVNVTTPLSEAAARKYEIDRAITNRRMTVESLMQRKARSKVAKTLDFFDRQIEAVREEIALFAQQEVTATAEYDALRLAEDVKNQTIRAYAIADLLAKYGEVQWSEANGAIPAHPTHVEFDTPVGRMAIAARRDYAFEVGLRSDDENRYFQFGMDVDIYGPDRGWTSSSGETTGRRAAKVNWGSHGSSDSLNARQYATAINIAADLCDAVNTLLGITDDTAY